MEDRRRKLVVVFLAEPVLEAPSAWQNGSADG